MNNIDWNAVGMASGFGGICGWLSYLLKVEEGKKFSFKEFILHGAISAVCGLICFELLRFEGLPAELCGSLSGVAGWGGTRLIRLVEILIRRRAQVSKAELDEEDHSK